MKLTRVFLLLLCFLCYFSTALAKPAQTWKTGQTDVYADGDDGDLQHGVDWPEPRFEDNGDGTVTDHLTGLIWLKNANCAGAMTAMTWNDALTFCNNLASGTCGLTDGSSAGEWRLPNRKELLSLIDYSRYNPALPQGHLFDNVQSSYYWSATTNAYFTDRAWFVYMKHGGVNSTNKSMNFYYYVWPVRAGQSGSFEDSVILKLTIYDTNTGVPVEGANVTLAGVVGETGADGLATFPDLSLGEYDVEISAEGYFTHSTKINLNQSGTIRAGYGLVPIAGTTSDNPVITDVVSFYSNRNKEAFFINGVDFNVNFSAVVNWNGKTADKIRFITPNNTYDETTGNHTFNMGSDFGEEGRLTVVAIRQDGTQSEPFDANIEVMPLPPGLPVVPGIKNDGSSFSYKIEIKDSYSFFTDIIPVEGLTVSSDIPIFGDKQISLGIGANINVTIGNDGTASYSIVRPDGSGFAMAGVSFDTGYELGGEITFQYKPGENAWRFDGGYVIANMSVEKGIGPSYTIVVIGPVPVPVYLRGELGAELNSTIGFTGWAEGNGWQLDGILEPGAGGRAIAGVGIASALAVEGYLGIDASMMLGFPVEPVFREASIAMSGGITLVALFFEYEKPLWEYTWSWPDGSEPSSLRTLLAEEPLSDIRGLDWKPIPRNYKSGIPKKDEQITTLSALSSALDGTEQTLPGQIDIYPYSYPSLINMDNDLLLAWITDDLTKTENNRTSLVFSKFSEDQWSTPADVDQDGTADFYPDMATISGGAVIAWQDSGIVFAEDATMDDMLPQQEISVCLYDSTNSSWGARTRLTSNANLDRSPVVATSNDKAAVVWVSNEQNDMIGSADKPNSLKCSFFDGTSWSPQATIASGLKAIVKTSLAYSGDNVTYVFVIDDDGDLSTVVDQDLYLAVFNGTTWSSITRLTDDDVQDTNPQLAYDQNGDLLLVWYKDGDFQMAKNLDMANSQTVVEHELSSGAADFRLAVGSSGQISILWPDSSPKGQDIYMAMYDPNLNIWGKGTMLTDTDSMERSLTSVQTTDGKIAIVYNRVETITTTRQVQVGGEMVDVQVPGAGKTDLCMATISIDGDLSVNADAISITPAEITLGGSLDISATVSNVGLKGAEDIPVEFYYGDPANDGALIGSSQTIPGPLAPGSFATVSIVNWPVPDVPDVNKDIYVIVDPHLGYEDRDRGNNVAHVSVFNPDIEISQMYWQAVGPVKRAVTVSVKNIGTVPTASVPVVIKKQGPSGEVLCQDTIVSLSVNETIDVVYEWDTTGEQTSDGYLKVYATANVDQAIPESSYLNNNRTIQVLGAIPGAITNPSIPSGETGVSIRPVLDWDDVSGATSYDLYLWKIGNTKPETPTAIGLTESQYILQTSLLPQTTYYWQVVAKNDSGETVGPEWTFTTKEIIAGDINDDGNVNLTDAVLALQVAAGIQPSATVHKEADVNGDGKIGIEEVIYILQKVSGLRE